MYSFVTVKFGKYKTVFNGCGVKLSEAENGARKSI